MMGKTWIGCHLMTQNGSPWRWEISIHRTRIKKKSHRASVKICVKISQQVTSWIISWKISFNCCRASNENFPFFSRPISLRFRKKLNQCENFSFPVFSGAPVCSSDVVFPTSLWYIWQCDSDKHTTAKDCDAMKPLWESW